MTHSFWNKIENFRTKCSPLNVARYRVNMAAASHIRASEVESDVKKKLVKK
jgi:hypothetical protein